jgi:hypothetical protein
MLNRLFAALQRRLDPGVEEHRARMRELVAAVSTLSRETQTATHDQQQAIDRLAAASLENQQHHRSIERDVTWLRTAVARQRRVNARLLRRAELDERSVRHAQRARERLRRLAGSRLPIIVGPWTGEVGFELLYWIPFLQWAMESFPIARERLVVLSRGGVAGWYGHVADAYVDAFTHVTPEEFRAATEAVKKQRTGRGFERKLLRAAMRERGLTRVHVLHPALMYDLFWSFWAYVSTVKQLDEHTLFKRLPAPPPLDGLPASYVAARFYFSRCFPDTADNRAFVSRTLARLAERTDVVLLNTPFSVDDHSDVTLRAPRVHTIAERMDPPTNLAVQSAVIAGARAFIGTYGGYSYLAPLYGVDSVGFYSRATFKRQHLDLAHRAFGRIGAARLSAVDITSVTALDLAVGSSDASAVLGQ